MKRAVFVGMAISVALGASVAWAQGQTQQQASERDRRNATALDLWVAGQDTSDSRKDVLEVTRPLPPRGPASFHCSPGSPICP